MTGEGKRWTRWPVVFGPSIAEVMERQELGEGAGKLYVVKMGGFLDAGGYSVFHARSLLEWPVLVAHTREVPRVVRAGMRVEVWEGEKKAAERVLERAAK